MNLIDRDAMLKAFDEFCGEFKGIRKVLEDVPAVDAAPVVHGEWIKTFHEYANKFERCMIAD